MDPCDKEIVEKAKARALHLLEYMDRTEKGMRMKLQQGGYPPEAIEETMDFLKYYGYIDDRQYAYRYLSTRSEGKGRRRLFQELYQKGVCASLVQEAWEELSMDEGMDEKASIRELVERKAGGQTSLSQKEYRKLTGFLSRRGFGWEDIHSVFQEMGICIHAWDG